MNHKVVDAIKTYRQAVFRFSEACEALEVSRVRLEHEMTRKREAYSVLTLAKQDLERVKREECFADDWMEFILDEDAVEEITG